VVVIADRDVAIQPGCRLHLVHSSSSSISSQAPGTPVWTTRGIGLLGRATGDGDGDGDGGNVYARGSRAIRNAAAAGSNDAVAG
jgi:hypothetical protein